MIELKEVTKQFDDFKVLDKISLTIPKGAAFGLLGSNGAGKSTILRLISGIYSAEEGEVTADNQNIYDNPAIKERIFFINDETIQFTNFTLEELKNYYKSFYPKFSEELFEKLRTTINLPLKKKLNAFSKGMKRQAVVITALACQTDYLLLDEAFSALDYQTRLNVTDDVYRILKREQVTTLMVTHDIPESISMGDKILVLSARPAQVKEILSVDFGPGRSPLSCRANRQFGPYFDHIWKELSTDEKS